MVSAPLQPQQEREGTLNAERAGGELLCLGNGKRMGVWAGRKTSGAGGKEHVDPQCKGCGSSRWVFKSMQRRWLKR